MRYNRYNDEFLEEQFPGLAADLMASRFPKAKHPAVALESWLLLQYDRACEERDAFNDNAAFINPVLNTVDYADLWHGIIEEAFNTCKSITAKKAIWEAAAVATVAHNCAMLVKQAAPLLYERARWMPANAKDKRIDIFCGTYSEKDYRLTTLVAATQRLQMGDTAANEHVRQWLKSMALAPGVLPARKRSVTSNASAREEVRDNQLLWWEVVVPFCQKNPQEQLLSDKIFFYLPIMPGKETGQHLIQSLPSPHQQQWAYANIVGANNPEDTREFWKMAFPQGLDSSLRDCRLHLALLQLKADDAKALAREIDLPMVAMLETLDAYDVKTMAEMLYGRWFCKAVKAEEAPQLPQDWYDDTALGF